MHIGPRTGEAENHVQHFWFRKINGVEFFFVHVKVSRLGYPHIMVSRYDTGETVRCSCRRPDCPLSGKAS